jgi:hypothetical protein
LPLRGWGSPANISYWDQSTFTNSRELIDRAPLPSWVARLGNDGADPFNSLPVPSSPRVDLLVKYCQYCILNFLTSDVFFSIKKQMRCGQPQLTQYSVHNESPDEIQPEFNYCGQAKTLVSLRNAEPSGYACNTCPGGRVPSSKYAVARPLPSVGRVSSKGRGVAHDQPSAGISSHARRSFCIGWCRHS